ncbi:MAG: hypothetical protein JXR12_15090 [Neptunomonas phycophila]|uniref:hypothetical protein n=1 Tax=Neptunomonas phycophila TaxID=1572645 RepID=UPI003B8AF4E7
MRLDTPISFVLNNTDDIYHERVDLSSLFNIDAIEQSVRASLDQFVFQPMTQETMQNIQNTLAVNLYDVKDDAGVAEISFSAPHFDIDGGNVSFDVTVTPYASCETVDMSIVLAS